MNEGDLCANVSGKLGEESATSAAFGDRGHGNTAATANIPGH